ncbi:hypothetical protein K458DRAFT_381425 [Lentithecium fluviatile CBS 122367]|uniref:Uncharacterized protein n=1 Tax=Lentithecium fluviatile CBS 122367 TaxID=1168545 RepID=A0A6G1JMB8_9PLEO|nr:hypothetical protein K458DRAFT_381425 [Lentithecium fluviatile CBS 122367]
MPAPAKSKAPEEPADPGEPSLTNFSRALKASWRPRCDMCDSSFDNFDPKLPMRCKPCALTIDEWVEAPSWDILLDHNRDFIDGLRTATPYSIYPLYAYKALHPGLHRLHDYGILTTDAQSPWHKVGQEKDGTWFEVKERSYLRCVIPTMHPNLPTAKVAEMVELLLENNRLETVTFYEYYDYYAGKYFPEMSYRSAPPIISRKSDPNKQPLYTFFRSSVGPSITTRTVAKHRSAETKNSLEWVKWKRCKHNRLPVVTERDLPRGSMGRRAFGREITSAKKDRPIVFTVAVRDWADLDLDLCQVVVDACIRAGLEPVFEETEAVAEEGIEGAEYKKGEVGAEELPKLDNLQVD